MQAPRSRRCGYHGARGDNRHVDPAGPPALLSRRPAAWCRQASTVVAGSVVTDDGAPGHLHGHAAMPDLRRSAVAVGRPHAEPSRQVGRDAIDERRRRHGLAPAEPAAAAADRADRAAELPRELAVMAGRTGQGAPILLRRPAGAVPRGRPVRHPAYPVRHPGYVDRRGGRKLAVSGKIRLHQRPGPPASPWRGRVPVRPRRVRGERAAAGSSVGAGASMRGYSASFGMLGGSHGYPPSLHLGPVEACASTGNRRFTARRRGAWKHG